MPTSYSTLLGLALPVTGELSGTWGDEVNNYITQYLDSAVAGTQTISGSQTAVTLSRTTNAALSQAGSGSTGSSQYQVINCTGNPASTLTVTVPSTSKVYLVLNNTSTSQSVVVKPSAAAGVTVSAARAALIAWNGTDFELVGTDDASRLNGVLAAANGGTGQSSYTVGDILFASGSTTLSKLADVATGNALISGGVGVAPSYGKIGLTTHVSGTLPIANGGTNGTATPTAGTIAYGTGTAYAFNTAGTSGQPLLSGGAGVPTFGTLGVAAGGTGLTSTPANGALDIGNGTGFTRATLTAGSGVSISNGSGSITISATGSGGTVTSVGATSPVASSGGNTPTISLNSAYGDTLNPYGSKTANFFLAAPNGSAGAPTFRAIVAADIPTLNQNTTGTAANITASSNSTLTTLSSLSLPGSQVSGNISGSAGNVTGTVAVANGGTGSTTLTANNVLLGNGASAVQVVAPGTSGNVLTSNGTTWTSAAPTGGGGGATSKGSLLFYSARLVPDANNRAFLTTYASDNVFTTPFKPNTQLLFFNTSSTYTLSCVSFSSFYNCYFAITRLSTGSTPIPMTSKDGLGWSPVISWQNLVDFGSQEPLGIGVNDSNGNIYVITNSGMWFSTNGGTTFTENANGYNGNFPPSNTSPVVSFRYLNSGTASTSRALFIFNNGNNELALFSLAGNAAASGLWSYQIGLTGVFPDGTYNPTIGTYGSKMAYLFVNSSSTGFICYEATTNTFSANANIASTLGIANMASTGGAGYFIALNNSFWIAPSSNTNQLSYGSVSGTSLAFVGSVSLSNSRRVNTCLYDNTRWLAITSTGLWASTQANPSSGWAKVGTPNLGFTGTSQFNSSGSVLFSQTSVFQRDPLY
jgi:hypothetical protein